MLQTLPAVALLALGVVHVSYIWIEERIRKRGRRPVRVFGKARNSQNETFSGICFPIARAAFCG
jgi:hypothetical protein